MGEIVLPALTAPEAIRADHDLSQFESGELVLDEWLRKRALKNSGSGASQCFVICADQAVVGYYSLSSSAVAHEVAPKAMRRNMPDPLPALLLGRLAVQRRFHNLGLGSALLRDATLRAISISREVGVSLMLVHALHEQARRFYLSRGFVQSPVQDMTLMMTLATLQSILVEPDAVRSGKAS